MIDLDQSMMYQIITRERERQTEKEREIGYIYNKTIYNF